MNRLLFLIFILMLGLVNSLRAQEAIKQYEYWFGGNYSGRSIISISPVSSFNLVGNIPTNALTSGLHTFHIRFKDNKSLFSSVTSQVFVKVSATATADKKIVAYEYWFDNNYSGRVSTSVSPVSEFNFVGDIPTNTLPYGLHTFHIRFKDDKSFYSSVISQPFVKLSLSASSDKKIVAYEYWFDNDFAHRVRQSIQPQAFFQLNTPIPSFPLSIGVHNFNIRFKDDAGMWSSTVSQTTNITVVSTLPMITSVNPVNGTAGTTVTITGANFSTTAADNIVKFNGTTATVIGTPTATSITTTVPTGATNGKITVTVGGQVATSAIDFAVTVTAPPTITSFNPTSGATGATIAITGTNFSTTAANNIVKFNGVTATIIGTPSATSISATVPAGATTGKITIIVGGQVATSASDFTATSPAVVNFAPTNGPVGTTVTITGANFSTTPANNIVKFNNTTAVVTSSTATSITTTVPTGAATGTITATVGGQTATSATSFTVTTPPAWFGVYVNDVNHPHLQKNALFVSTDFTQSNLDPLRICADGSSVTVVKYLNRNNAIPNSNIKFRVKSDPSGSKISEAGTFTLKPIEIGDTVIAQFTHPQFVNATTAFRSDAIEIFNVATNALLNQYPIKVYRAPVVFVHGLWGDSATFTKMKKTFSSKVPLSHSVDYRYSNNSNFFTNRYVVRFGIDDVLRKARVAKFSAGKVVVIGHSMGGILSRLYLQSTYASPLYRFDISRLITLNTPHMGTQSANLLIAKPGLRSLANLMSRTKGTNASEFGAISDLRVNSFPINSHLNIPQVKQNKVPSTTISTDGVGDPSSLAAYFKDILSIASTQTIFNNEINDLVVPKSSQEGNIRLSITFPAQWHIGSAENNSIIAQSLILLDEDPTQSALFTKNGFPPGVLTTPNFEPTTSGGRIASSSGGRIASTDSLKIISPVTGQSFNQGDSVSVNLFQAGSISKTGLFILGSSIEPISAILPQNSTKLKFKIPSNAIGSLSIWTLGSGSNNLVVHDSIHININSSLVPDSIVSNPKKINLALGVTLPVSVVGYFSGNPINLGGSQELSFGYDQLYLNKIANAVFQGKKVGSTNVLISYKAKTFNLLIDIQNDPSRLITSFDQSASEICSGSTVQFKNKSIGLGTAYKWTFAGGSPTSSTQSDPSIMYSTPGRYLVKLKTTFVNGLDSAFIDSLIYVKPVPAKPAISQSGLNLTSSASQGNQWYFNGIPIKGANNPTFNITTFGTYTVVSTINGCASLVSQGNQMIAFETIPDKTLGDPAFTLNAIASSGLTIQYSTTSDKVSISGNQVTLVKAGGVTITAGQTGDTQYAASGNVNQTFCITPAKPTITKGGTDTEPVLTSSSDTGNQWFLNDVAISGATNKTFTVKEAGVYKVHVTSDNCVSVFSTTETFIVTGDIPLQTSGITIYPNPVNDYLELLGLKGEVSNIQLYDMTGRSSTLMIEKRNDTHHANVQHLSQGLYLLRFQENNTIRQVKFIKN